VEFGFPDDNYFERVRYACNNLGIFWYFTSDVWPTLSWVYGPKIKTLTTDKGSWGGRAKKINMRVFNILTV
jgi:hypothetical protein